MFKKIALTSLVLATALSTLTVGAKAGTWSTTT